MGGTIDIGRRIELVPMDPHFQNITIGLYRQEEPGGTTFQVYSYSGVEGAQQRVDFVTNAMSILGGMQPAGQSIRNLRFPCGAAHALAARRAFLEACKIAPATAVDLRKLSIYDKKSAQNIVAGPLGSGAYEISADGSDPARASAVAGGLVKLGEMVKTDNSGTRLAFPCGESHDALVGLLLVRALNVRAVLREEEMAAARGVLAAPSAQK